MDLESRKVLTVRHVSFNEGNFPALRWNKDASEADAQIIEEGPGAISAME